MLSKQLQVPVREPEKGGHKAGFAEGGEVIGGLSL